MAAITQKALPEGRAWGRYSGLVASAGRLVPPSMIALAVALVLLPLAYGNDWNQDLASYRYGVDAWVAGRSPYHRDLLAGPFEMARLSGHAYIYPPPAVLFLAPWVVAPAVGIVAGGLVLVSGLLAIVRQELGRVSLAWTAGILLALALSGTLAQGVVLGNLSPLMGGLLAWAYVGRAGWAGSLAGVLKVTPGLMAALDGWRGILTAGAIAVVVAVVTLPLVGVQAWLDFLTVMRNAEPDCVRFTSVACLAAPAVGMVAAKGLTLALALTLAGAAAVVRPRLGRLLLVTLALYVSATELKDVSHYHVYAAPLIVAVAARMMPVVAWLGRAR